VLRMVEKWPVIIHVGSAVLAFTAAQMIINEKLLDPLFDGGELINNLARGATYVLAITGVLVTGWWASRKEVQNETETQSV
jgi:predicted tellurium resistance membrane protein TerC